MTREIKEKGNTFRFLGINWNRFAAWEIKCILFEILTEREKVNEIDWPSIQYACVGSEENGYISNEM